MQMQIRMLSLPIDSAFGGNVNAIFYGERTITESKMLRLHACVHHLLFLFAYFAFDCEFHLLWL